MKTGTGNDPFADDEESDGEQMNERDRAPEEASEEDTADTVLSEGKSESELSAETPEEGVTDDRSVWGVEGTTTEMNAPVPCQRAARLHAGVTPRSARALMPGS